jgi:hypothetical protein
MAENAFALTAEGIELNEFGKLDREDWDWGHLQPGQFRFCFLPRTPLRRPGDGDESSDVSSVSSDGMMDQMAHIAEEGLHAAGAMMAAGAGVVGHAAYDASAKVGRAMANDLFGDDADTVVHKVEETIEDAERYAAEKMAEATEALHKAEEKASAVLHAGEDLAKKVGGEALHAVGDVGGKALHAVDDAAHAVGAEVMKDLGKVGDVVGGLGTGMFNKAKGLVGVSGGEELGPVKKSNVAALFAIDAMPARRRGDAGSSPLDGASTAAPSPSNDVVKNIIGAHWLIATQVEARHGRGPREIQGPGRLETCDGRRSGAGKAESRPGSPEHFNLQRRRLDIHKSYYNG